MLPEASLTITDDCCLSCHVCLFAPLVDLTIRKTPAKHQRMPSHEAILKVAKQHKLPAPELPGALAASQQQHQRQAAAAATAAATQRTAGAAAAPASGGLLRRGVSSVAAAVGGSPPPAAAVPLRPCSPDGAQQSVLAAAANADTSQLQAEAAYGEPWQSRKERVQLTSPHGRWVGVHCLSFSSSLPSAALRNLPAAPPIMALLPLLLATNSDFNCLLLTQCTACHYTSPGLCRRPGWDLRCVIVKTGDDCRQELLAMQLIHALHEIFAEAQLPLWLKPYEVRACLGLGPRVLFWKWRVGTPSGRWMFSCSSSLHCWPGCPPPASQPLSPHPPSHCQPLPAGPAHQQPHSADRDGAQCPLHPRHQVQEPRRHQVRCSVLLLCTCWHVAFALQCICLPATTSLHLQCVFASYTPPCPPSLACPCCCCSLRDHMSAKFVAGSPAFLRAQRCFVESLAAYSLVCYLLQIKDRCVVRGRGQAYCWSGGACRCGF
jgi:hypothetical protein